MSWSMLVPLTLEIPSDSMRCVAGELFNILLVNVINLDQCHTFLVR